MSPLPGSVLSFNPTPSIERSGDVVVTVARAVPDTRRSGRRAGGGEGHRAPPARAGPGHARGLGFDGKVGQTLVVPRRDGPSVVAVGIGDPAALDAARLRDAAAALRPRRRQARPAGDHAGRRRAAVDAEVAGQAVVEGILLARYRYGALKKETRRHRPHRHHAGRCRRAGRPASAGAPRVATSSPTPPSSPGTSPTRRPGTSRPAASPTWPSRWPRRRAWRSRCSTPTPSPRSAAAALLGVNAGSEEPPRMIKLTLPAERSAERSPGARRQRRDVRLRRHQPQAQRRQPRLDEDGHVGRRGRAVVDVDACRRSGARRR